MALYDGFFDAEYNEETGEYDRSYGSGDFTQYFGQLIGSGVCVTEDLDSCKVRLAGTQALVNMGYLFIRGYWLKVADDPYALDLTGTGPLAVTAYLNTGKKMIELEAVPAAESYPADTLVLAVVDPAAGTAEDTRYDTGVCGVIDSAGGLSDKAAFAIDYIEKEIGPKFEQIEADINAQETRLEGKIEEVGKVVEKIAPLPIGIIKFSANPDLGEEWLRCDGRFVSKEEYPELVELLRMPPIGLSDLREAFGSNVKPSAFGISNGVIFQGWYWVLSGLDKILYGYNLSTKQIKRITITTQSSPNMSGSVISIITFKSKNYLFICNGTKYGPTSGNDRTNCGPDLYVGSDFSTSITTLSVVAANVSNGDTLNIYTAKTYSPVGGVMEFNSKLYIAGPTIYYNSMYARIFEIVIVDSNTINVNRTSSGLYITTMYHDSAKWGVGHLAAFSPKNNGGLSTLFNLGNLSTDYSTVSISMYRGIESEGIGEKSSVFSLEKFKDGDYKLDLLGENEVLIRYQVKGTGFAVASVSLDSITVNYAYALDGILPDGSAAFKDSAVYIKRLDLWAFFVGTGIIFAGSLKDPEQYEFYDTQPVLGNLPHYGYIDYDENTKSLYILGQNVRYEVKLGILNIPDGYNPLNGDRLPTLTLSSVPAYIKAKESGEAGT